MARSHDNEYDEVHFEQDSCRIILKQGDLLEEDDVDVKVIPTPDYGQQSGKTYPLYEAILSKADRNLKAEIKRSSVKITPHEPPQMIFTTKPLIILTPTPYYRNEKKAFKLLQDTYLACLRLAVDEKCQTIAFPTIGCGESGFKSIDAADNLYKALVEFGQSSKNKLSEIRIVIYSNKIYNEFANAFMDLAQEKNAKIKLIDVSPSNSKTSEIASRGNNKQTSQQSSRNTEPQGCVDNWDDDRMRRTSNLNPETEEFQPYNKNRKRAPRHYRLSNKSTELIILKGDILQTKVDAIVNAANESMLGGGGVDGVIHKAAGDELYKACKAHKKIYPEVRLPTGRSRILLSYNMSKTTYYIINTSGPRYDDAPPAKCKEDLISCYKTSLALANLYDLETIGYTAISCGIFGYPIDEGAEVALQTVNTECDSMGKIFFVLRDDDIYDAWVAKADQLKFISLDGHGAVASTVPTQSSDERKDKGHKSERNDETEIVDQKSTRKVIDQSTPKHTEKKPAASNRESSRKLSSDSKESSHSEETARNKENDDPPKEDDEKESVPSGQQNNTRRVIEIPSEQEQSQPKTVEPKAGTSLPKTKKSTVNGSLGRGRVPRK